MSVADLLGDLNRRGVRLAVAEGKVRLDGPAGVITEADRQAVRDHKPALVALLEGPPPLDAAAVPPAWRSWLAGLGPRARRVALDLAGQHLADDPALTPAAAFDRAATYLQTTWARCPWWWRP
jgi:hypothetical protein